MWKFPVSLFVFSPEVQALRWVAPLSCKEGFSHGRLFCLCSHSLAACPLPLPPSSACHGWNWGEQQCLPPFASLVPRSLSAPRAEEEPEQYVLWRMWRWVSVPVSCILLCHLPYIWASLRERGCASSDSRSVWLARVPLVRASQAGSWNVCM